VDSVDNAKRRALPTLPTALLRRLRQTQQARTRPHRLPEPALSICSWRRNL